MEKYKYLQLTQTIKQAINSGEYPVGKPLPGERELAEKHSCSRQTVRKAVSVLCAENILKPVHGSGNYVLKKSRATQNGLVGVIATHISLPNYLKTLSSIEHTILAGGCYPVIATTGNRFDLERQVLEDLLEKNIDGLVVEGVLSAIPNPNIHIYKKIVAQGVPVVFLNNYYTEIEEAVHITMDNTQGGILCAKYLLSKGHKNIGAIFKADDQESIQRYSSLARQLNEHGCSLNDSTTLWYTSYNLHKYLEDFALSCIKNCSAVAFFNDELAFEFYNVLRQKGIEIPDNFEFVALDRTEFALRLPHKLVAIKYRQETIGKLAATKILNMMQGKTETSTLLQWQLYDTTDNVLTPPNFP